MTDELSPRAYLTLLSICCVVVFGCYLGTYMRMPVVPLYAVTLGADTVEVGLINAAFLLMAGVLSVPLGLASDRLGTKLTAALGVLILSASSFLVCLSRTPGQLIWIYLFSGVGLAAFGPTMMAFVANISPATHLGRSYGWYTTAIYAGMTLGPAAGGFLAQGVGYSLTFLISGLSIFLTFWVFFFFLPGSRGPGIPRPSRGGATLTAMGKLLHNRPLLGCWLATLGGCFGLGMFITFLPLHAQNQGLTLGQIGLIFATQGIVNVLVRIPFGHLSDRAGSPRRPGGRRHPGRGRVRRRPGSGRPARLFYPGGRGPGGQHGTGLHFHRGPHRRGRGPGISGPGHGGLQRRHLPGHDAQLRPHGVGHPAAGLHRGVSPHGPDQPHPGGLFLSAPAGLHPSPKNRFLILLAFLTVGSENYA